MKSTCYLHWQPRESRHGSTSLLLLQNAEWGFFLGVFDCLIKWFTLQMIFYGILPMNTPCVIAYIVVISQVGMCLDVIVFLLPSIANCFNCGSEQETHPYNPSSFLFLLNFKHFCKLMCCHVLFLVLSPKQSTFEEFFHCLNMLFRHKNKKLLSTDTAICFRVWRGQHMTVKMMVCFMCEWTHEPCGKWNDCTKCWWRRGGFIVIYVKHTVFFPLFFANILVSLKCEYFSLDEVLNDEGGGLKWR